MVELGLVQETKAIAGLKVKVGESLGRYTSNKVGGPADYFFEVETRAALTELIRLLSAFDVPFCLLGKGSNVLVSDLGVRGAVIRLSGEFKRIEWLEKETSGSVRVGAAYPVTQLVRAAVKQGYRGLEFAEGIPGSVGGALVMNAGAYGTEFEKIVTRVEGVAAKGDPVGWERRELNFSYRNSHLPRGTIVTQVDLRLSKGNPDEMQQRLRELTAKRKQSQPSGYPNSGSVFRNPKGDYAGRLIEASGLKGKKIGKAQISERHANFIVNLGGAKAHDVKALIELAQAEVQKKFGVVLEPEVHLLGEWDA